MQISTDELSANIKLPSPANFLLWRRQDRLTFVYLGGRALRDDEEDVDGLGAVGPGVSAPHDGEAPTRAVPPGQQTGQKPLADAHRAAGVTDQNEVM